MTIKTRGKPRTTRAVEETVVENKKKVAVAKNKKAKIEQPVIIPVPEIMPEPEPAILPIRVQDSIVRTVLDRLNGKSVILHGIDRTKT